MFLLLYRVCIHVKLASLAMGNCFHVFVLMYRVCTHVRLGILAMRFCVDFCDVVEGMYTCKTGNFGNDPLLLFLCCFRG